MHIGGLHIFAGLFYLLLSMLLVCGYYLCLYLLLPLGQRLLARVKRIMNKQVVQPWPLLWFVTPEKRRRFVVGLGLIVLLMGGFYLHQRLTWLGDNNANYAAKEYYIAGQPLALVRIGLCEIFNPENRLLMPLNALQRSIYARGTALLPENDGEHAAWKDMWFHYPYIRRMHNPYGTSHRRASLPMRQLLDDIYATIEIVATHPFADGQIEQEASKKLPRAAFYYSLNCGYYADKKIGSYWPLLHDVAFVRKKKNLNHWLVELRQRWIAADNYDEIKRSNPKIELTRQLLVIHFSSDLLTASLYPKEFTCHHPRIADFLQARRDFTDPKADDYVWGTLYKQDPKQAELLYTMAIDAESVSFSKYMLNHYCAIEVPGEERFYADIDKKWAKKQLVPALKSGFHNEIDLLEEGFDGH